ncbi:MAG: 16S rRNA (uracil(1498)-N(3))-methyltransferase [Lachnospiraceae bacterium]|nr:16S rRNA (uracil(1498)-N(3))-methyltransferase [Lachnospiraceae bacterium]
MYHFFIEPQQVQGQQILITGPDVVHMRNVLRMKAGEEVSVSDGRGRTYVCKVERVESEQVALYIQETEEISTEPGVSVTLYQGLPKGDKMELIVQKGVELGVARIVPVVTRRTIVKLDEKKAAARVSRWNGIARSAAEQSGRWMVPEVAAVCSFAQAVEEAGELDQVVIPYELAQDMAKTREILGSVRKGQSVGIFIGPEGGFDEAEVEQVIRRGGRPITLGRRILRTETAGMAVLAMLTFLLE